MDDLSQRPDFGPEEPLPYEVPDSWRQPWPYGLLRGQPLYLITTMSLHSLLKWAQEHDMCADLVPIMQEILESRAGE